MKTARLVKYPSDGSATSWVVTVQFDDEPDRVFTFAAAQAVDVSFTYDSLLIERDSVDVTPTITENSCAIYLRDTVQVFGTHSIISPVTFGVWALFWAFVLSRLLR